jgi:phosphoglycerate dehydrogenase-like enzyme
MRTAIVVHPRFDRIWPYAADHLRKLLEPLVDLTFIRVPDSDVILTETVPSFAQLPRLIALGVPVRVEDLDAMPSLIEAFIDLGYESSQLAAVLEERGIRDLAHRSEGYWGQSVSEFALGLTIAGLRRIPQIHQEILSSTEPWCYPLQQFGDDLSFTHGTVADKRVRIVGAGNIASRYASFVDMLGADVAAWDPFASEPSFHRSGTRREWHLDKLVEDAEIFVPMVPLLPATEGLVTAEHLRALPTGCLVVMVTRARICDTNELRRRVIAGELSLAADVFDVEPLPLDDPLLGLPNVVHTPHRAGRTWDANAAYTEMIAEKLAEYRPGPPPSKSVRTLDVSRSKGAHAWM